MGWWLALEGGYGTRLVEDDARHSRQHLDETTDRRASRSESVAAQEISRSVSGCRLWEYTDGKFR